MPNRFNPLTGRWEPVVVPNFSQGPPAMLARRLAPVLAPRAAQSAPVAAFNPLNPMLRQSQRFLGPQGGNEMNAVYAIRQQLNAPIRAIQDDARIVRRNLGAAFGDVKQFANELTATPNNPAGIFGAMLTAESGGRQADPKTGRVVTSPAGAIGIAQVMPGTAPEAAKLAGLPWDPALYRGTGKASEDYNKALGYAYFQEKLRENNGDQAKAVAAYNAGQGNVQKAERGAAETGQSWQAFLPQETQGYLAKVFRTAGQYGAAAPGVDPGPYRYAMNAVDQAAELEGRTVNAAFETTPLPPPPKPEEFQAPDFTAGDAAFEATAPKNPFDDPKEKVRTERQQYWKGIGQAMASLSGEEGIGTMLMRLGSGALVGRARGQEIVDEKESEFEKRMQEYNRALAQRNDTKAVTEANMLNKNIEQRIEYNNNLWKHNVSEIEKYNPQIKDGKLYTFKRNPETNVVDMAVTPLSFGAQAGALRQKADIALSFGQAQLGQDNLTFRSQQAAAGSAFGIATQVALAEGNPQAAGEGLIGEAGNRIRAMIGANNWQSLFGDREKPAVAQMEAQVRATVYGQLGVRTRPDGTPLTPLSGAAQQSFESMYNEQLTNRVMEAVIGAKGVKGLEALLTHPEAVVAYGARRAATARERENVNAKGQTTRSTVYGAFDE